MFFNKSVCSTRVAFDAVRLRVLTPTTHLVVVPAPGRGKAIQVVSASLKLDVDKNPFAFTNDLGLITGNINISKPQFVMEAPLVNSSFNEWAAFLPPLRAGSLKAGLPLTFGPLAGANTSFEADGKITLDVAYRVVKA